MNARLHVFGVLLAVAAPAVSAQGPAKARAQDGAAKAPFVFEAQEIELPELVQRCAVYLQWNIVAEQGAFELRNKNTKGEVEVHVPVVALQQPVVTDAAGCEELLSGLLWSHGLALVPLDEPKQVYEILSMSGPRQREIMSRAVQRTPAQVLARPTLRQCVVTAVTLEHTNAMIASNSLRPFFTTNNQRTVALTLGTIGNDRTLLLSGPQDMVANALMILEAADVPQPPVPSPALEARLDELEKKIGQLLQRLERLEQAGAGR